MPAKSIFSKDVGSSLANYPHAKRVGDFVFLSGLSARQTDNSIAGVQFQSDGSVATSISEQTEAVINNMRQVLQAAGGDLRDLVDVTVFLTDMKLYEGFNKDGPARTTVAVSKLPGEYLLIEVKGTAFIPEN